MQRSFNAFLRNLYYCQAHHVENTFLKHLTDNQLSKLKSLELIKYAGELDEIYCQSCENDHFSPIRFKNDQHFTICPHEDHRPNIVSPEDYALWEFNIAGFLQQIANKLEIRDRVEKLSVHNMWQIGNFTNDDTLHTCYFYFGQNFSEAIDLIKKQEPNLHRYVFLTSQQESATSAVDHDILLIEITDLIDLKVSNIHVKKQIFNKYLTSGFRNVKFNPINGDIQTNGQLIANVTPSSPEYHFANKLWQHYNEPQSHRSLDTYVFDKTRNNHNETSGKRANKLRRSIKKNAFIPEILDQIIVATKNEDGENSYIMRNLY